MTKEIPLSQGKVALVDDADFDHLSQWKWHVRRQGEQWYASRNVHRADGRRTTLNMHRAIVDAGELEVDHIDGNGLNNVRANLRVCTPDQNKRNVLLRSVATGRFKGVTPRKSKGDWQARISINGKKKHLGVFADEIDAAKAYDAAARVHYGEYARLNFPLPGERPARRQE